MDARGQASAAAVVVTEDPELLEHVLAVAAAAGVQPQVVAEVGAVRQLWAGASTIMVGVDKAAHLADMVLSRRPGVFVVGTDAARDQVCLWSLPLGAAVVLLPSGANRLATAMADASGLGVATGQLVAVVGGSGGVGVSTCTAGLAFVGAQRGLKTMLIDADPLSGGIDLLVGAERVPGWRWPRLANARGHLGNLAGQLPRVDGVDLLAMARGQGEVDPGPDAEQMKSVLLSARRTHELVVVDVPRHLSAASREVLRRADVVLLLVPAQLRGIAAAQQMTRQLADACTTVGLIVRLTRPLSLPADVVADGLRLPLVAALADDPGLALAAARGEPPGRAARSQLARSWRSVLDRLTVKDAAA